MWGIIWPIVVGFAAGLIARLLKPGQTNPSGFVLTVLLGIGGAFAGTFLGQFFGFYQPGEQAGFGGSIIGAIAILLVWGRVASKKTT